MRYCRFRYNGTAQFGLIETFAGREEITRTLNALPDMSVPEKGSNKIASIPLEQATLLASVEPSKIVCIGRNYREHAAELGHEIPTEPLLFLKAPSALIAPGERIIRPTISKRVDHEAELGVVIGKRCRNVRPDEDVRAYILGYTCVNDVTARDLQEKDGQWSRSKGFDTFCPVGPVVTDSIDPWAGVAVEARVNGTTKQHGNTRDFIFPVDLVVRHIVQAMTLFPGDLIATGTPSGVSPMVAGDVVEVTVQGIGTLKNLVSD